MSILNDVKHALGLLPSDTSFDSDIIMHINTAFATLNQLGVGDADGYMIEDGEDEWEDFIPYPRFNGVKSYIYLRVKLMFDPPQIGFVISSMDRQIQELEWRLLTEADPPMPTDEAV